MAKDNNNIKSKKQTIINRYGFIVFLFLAVFITILVYIVRIMFVEGEQWRALGVKETIKKDREIKPNRGNIYAVDGRLLATSEPLYGVYMDFMAEGIRKDTLMKYVGDLSVALAKKYPDRNATQYKNLILNGWDLSRRELAEIERIKASGSDKKFRPKSRYIRLIKRDVNYVELKELRTYPFLNQRSNRTGMIVEERSMRAKPFGRLAGRTIGSIYKDMEKGGASGIELKYDSILRGKPGVKSRQKIQGRWLDVVEVPAEDGWDVKTTIDVDIQDITEKALYSKLAETGAESGTAIIMEVATGEIKAISNLDRISEGVYAEGNPNAFSYMSEPGSTFKTLSIMIALEDGVVTPDEKFHVGTGLYQYGGRTIRDHYWRHGVDKGDLTVAQGIQISSNIVVAKTILKGYEKNPERYVQRLYETGITKKIDWDVPLQGKEGTAIIRHPSDKSNYWSRTTLPWMSFGYETQVPPIYMLMFYNGIANGGKMIKPFITKAFMHDGKIEQEFTTEVINPSLCSPKTLAEIQQMLVGVINEGTGKFVGSKSFQIAGKTGTAMIASEGRYGSGYYVSFCGYFPAEKPLYTCFVGIRRPKGVPSGGLMPGGVFKEIAEQVYSRNVYMAPAVCKPDTTLLMTPYVKNGLKKNLELVLNELKLPYVQPQSDAEWVTASPTINNIDIRKNVIENGLVPDVKGMGARDALFLMEKVGLRVRITGYGKVMSQSIPAGSRIVKGSLISLELK
ncbi:penicillin-binding protein [Dysgonomonas macrotermitis]|uniref:Cell division protein FtsI (Penicillin-binding protein 3) n=1 Tax=Dysgonomonas macrotermitis TaxID=1346286 RepID=A0A1M4U7W4_9BACT|nr:penicillin-binding protein [Dysgonomonas macrotermitis]SHE52693.1 cell division protein FtsI (penicillin-binding protein 3) [Dysgonomonas macrotermitis]